ncbi:MAG: DUF4185 domain-containing protein [Corynebacterium sp.]|nr:DUF4185 domain-containing protein [Corynebacterium sp.]
MPKKRVYALALTVAISTSNIAVPAASAQNSSDIFSVSSLGSSGSLLMDLWNRFMKLIGHSRIVPLILEVSPSIVTQKMRDMLGRGISDDIGAMAGDLGIMVPLDSDEFAIIFGDSFSGERFGEGDWMSPVGAIAAYDDGGQIKIRRPLNKGDRIEQLIDYEHNDNNLTMIPSDVINIDGTLYMQGMWNEGIGNVLGTEIWQSTDHGQTWESIATTDKNFMKGFGDLITWEHGDDGYIYVMSSRFKRNDGVYLSRFKPEQITDRGAWEHYVNGNWEANGGRTLSPIIKDKMKAGEMSLRFIDNHWVLSMFNAETASIEIRIADRIDADWNSIKPAHVVVAGKGGWRAEQTANNFTQLYGGYIAPGSTIANMNIVASQWNTATNNRYAATQFNVQGLDKFFGIGGAAEAPAEAATNDQAGPALRSIPEPADTATEDAPEGLGDEEQIVVRETPIEPTADSPIAPIAEETTEAAAPAAAAASEAPSEEPREAEAGPADDDRTANPAEPTDPPATREENPAKSR